MGDCYVNTWVSDVLDLFKDSEQVEDDWTAIDFFGVVKNKTKQSKPTKKGLIH